MYVSLSSELFDCIAETDEAGIMDNSQSSRKEEVMK